VAWLNMEQDFSLQPISVSGPGGNDAPLFPSRASSRVKPPFDADAVQTAIDFVLALEHPCMLHIPYNSNVTDDPTNHMMMASAPLVAQAPQTPQPNSSWTASGAIIKELLNLSSGINLEGEITPVEAWHRLHKHPDFHRLTPGGVEDLKRQLSSAVRCCGFGAVLDEDVFAASLERQFLGAATGYA